MIVNIVSLGCSKNTVDSEKIAAKLQKEGFMLKYDAIKPSFDFVLINTCGFIDKAKEESINTILNFVNIRKSIHNDTSQKNKDFKIIVFGCLAQRYRNELIKEIPEIDAIFGIMQEKEIVEFISNNQKFHKSHKIINNNNRILSTPKHYAYLKISEGCDRRCSFCAIPLIKGRHVSRKIEDIVSEATLLVKNGVKEIILIAQDTSYYGLDLYGERKLYDLLIELEKTDVHWIRLQYSYPNSFPIEILSLMQHGSKLCHYIDMPLQHINDRILSSMNRNISGKEVKELIDNIREKVPDIAFRTTLIVGYPAETIEEFNELKDFIKDTKFDRMGAFTYSKEEGTKAALLEDSLSGEQKEERLNILTDIQQEISFSLNEQKVGKTLEVIIDRKEGEYFIGRTQYDSPEVDNEVLIKSEGNEEMLIGNFYMVEITDNTEFDLYGKI